MSYGFIAILAGDWSETQGERWRSIGVPCRLSSKRMKLFAPKETPILSIPGNGALIGHLFTKEGNAVTKELLHRPNNVSLQEFLLNNFWGEYIAIEFECASDHTIRFIRDPSGGLPCFHSIRGDVGFVTSSVSLASRFGLYERKVNWDFIAHTLVYPYARSERTALSGINELLPGCSLSIKDHHLSTATVWSPWNFVSPSKRHPDQKHAKVEVRNAALLAVKAWANLDRSVLLELSGGLDSSIIAACLSRSGAKTKCCTLAGPFPEVDERYYAKLAADHFHFELLSARISLENARFDFPPPRDSVEPGMGILHYPVDTAISATADSLGTYSLFSGAGGDTVFCYLRGAVPAADAFRERGLSAAVIAVRNLSELHQCPLTRAGRLTLAKLVRGPKPPRRPNHEFLRTGLPFPALDPHPWHGGQEDNFAGDREKIHELIGTQCYRDGVARSARWPMRYPLLSQPVMEACLRVPTWMWISGGRDRSVARSAFSDMLPNTILNRRSKGSYKNYYAAIYERNKHEMIDYLITGTLSSMNLLNINDLAMEQHSSPSLVRPFSTRIFELCMIENWIRHQ